MTPLDLQAFHLTLPPTQDDLPYDDGVPMESQRHQLQMELLINALIPWLDAREDGYVGGNMFVYYSLQQVRHQDFRGPDVFVVLNVPKGERKSWVCWEEGKSPDVVIELLSVSTQDADKGEKKAIHQNQMRVAEYFWYDPFNPDDWAGFQLRGTYQPIAVNAQGQLVSQVLNLGLTRWLGTYQGVSTTWLRWVNLDGTLLPTPTELAEQRAHQAEQRADQAEQRAHQAEQQMRQTVQNLRQAGMDVAQIAQITGLSLDALAIFLADAG
ncbi:Uma2 family endonuclease [Trichothermofontia sichuanensis B231]|uniref:Uma2 family endonuclease n=1 Tax=Trichothermofontia sichuanensis TaxID=3045816 RepID=UPI002247618A|nr:Uma2 family endonuclease [Trichothermofontia sichuanensis]UZQ52877.1 Uma2 family endonuclease [Trichothermofontia sichuanensis B231]